MRKRGQKFKKGGDLANTVAGYLLAWCITGIGRKGQPPVMGTLTNVGPSFHKSKFGVKRRARRQRGRAVA